MTGKVESILSSVNENVLIYCFPLAFCHGTDIIKLTLRLIHCVHAEHKLLAITAMEGLLHIINDADIMGDNIRVFFLLSYNGGTSTSAAIGAFKIGSCVTRVTV